MVINEDQLQKTFGQYQAMPDLSNVPEEKKKNTYRTSNNRESTNLTDPIASFNSVQAHFDKIQENFNSMRQGITQTKTQLSEWVFQASRSQAPPSLDPDRQISAQQSSSGEDYEVVDRKDPILLELEKETQAFNPEIYLTKNNTADGPESLWQSTEVNYQTRLETIRGVLTFKLDHLTFDAH